MFPGLSMAMGHYYAGFFQFGYQLPLGNVPPVPHQLE